MGRRLDLQALLEELSSNVYFQPPTDVQMIYPCIRYMQDNARTEFADDAPYRYSKRYAVTVIDRDPDSSIPDQVAMLPSCTFNRAFMADGLNHWVFNLFF